MVATFDLLVKQWEALGKEEVKFLTDLGDMEELLAYCGREETEKVGKTRVSTQAGEDPQATFIDTRNLETDTQGLGSQSWQS